MLSKNYNISTVHELPGKGKTGYYNKIFIKELDKKDISHDVTLIYPEFIQVDFINTTEFNDPMVFNIGEHTQIVSCTISGTSRIQFNGIPGTTSISIHNSVLSGNITFGSNINFIEVFDSHVETLILNNLSRYTLIKIVNSAIGVFDLTNSVNSLIDFNLIKILNTTVKSMKLPTIKEFMNESR